MRTIPVMDMNGNYRNLVCYSGLHENVSEQAACLLLLRCAC